MQFRMHRLLLSVLVAFTLCYVSITSAHSDAPGLVGGVGGSRATLYSPHHPRALAAAAGALTLDDITRAYEGVVSVYRRLSEDFNTMQKNITDAQKLVSSARATADGASKVSETTDDAQQRLRTALTHLQESEEALARLQTEADVYQKKLESASKEKKKAELGLRKFKETNQSVVPDQSKAPQEVKDIYWADYSITQMLLEFGTFETEALKEVEKANSVASEVLTILKPVSEEEEEEEETQKRLEEEEVISNSPESELSSIENTQNRDTTVISQQPSVSDISRKNTSEETKSSDQNDVNTGVKKLDNISDTIGKERKNDKKQPLSRAKPDNTGKDILSSENSSISNNNNSDVITDITQSISRALSLLVFLITFLSLITLY